MEMLLNPAERADSNDVEERFALAFHEMAMVATCGEGWNENDRRPVPWPREAAFDNKPSRPPP